MLEETVEPQAQAAPETKTWDAAVVGAGYVGVPLAHSLAGAGRSVLLIDVSEEVVAALNRGESSPHSSKADRFRRRPSTTRCAMPTRS